MIDPETRRQRFIEATELLGGQRATARILDISDRSVRNLVAGKHDIRAGIMHDLTRALRERADNCARLAKDTDPLFTANLTESEAAVRRAAREAHRG